MLRSMVELPEERTMQFVVERACPQASIGPGESERIAGLPFPFAVWVKLGAVDPHPSDNCDGIKWLILEEDLARARSIIGMPTNVTNRYVCEHMGSLQE